MSKDSTTRRPLKNSNLTAAFCCLKIKILLIIYVLCIKIKYVRGQLYMNRQKTLRQNKHFVNVVTNDKNLKTFYQTFLRHLNSILYGSNLVSLTKLSVLALKRWHVAPPPPNNFIPSPNMVIKAYGGWA